MHSVERDGVRMVIAIEGVDPLFYQKPFGRQMDDLQKIEAFKKRAKRTHVKPTVTEVRWFAKHAGAKQVFARWHVGRNYWDDSAELFYL